VFGGRGAGLMGARGRLKDIGGRGAGLMGAGGRLKSIGLSFLFGLGQMLRSVNDIGEDFHVTLYKLGVLQQVHNGLYLLGA